jgi:hypothetical protein
MLIERKIKNDIEGTVYDLISGIMCLKWLCKTTNTVIICLGAKILTRDSLILSKSCNYSTVLFDIPGVSGLYRFPGNSISPPHFPHTPVETWP